MNQSLHYLNKILVLSFLAFLPSLVLAVSENIVLSAPSLNFFTQYSNGKITQSNITIYNKKRVVQSNVEINLSLPIPNYIKQALFSSATHNPFKRAYATFYTPTNFKQLKACPFTGIDFNLDNNLKTEEWYITTPATFCIKDQPDLSYSNSVTHNWIIQRDEKGKFRILMESDDTLTVDLATPQSLYKPLNTTHNVMRFIPKSPLGCGDVYMKWRYNNTKKQYQYITYYSGTAGCDRTLHYELNDVVGNKKALVVVNKVVIPWIKNNLPAFR